MIRPQQKKQKELQAQRDAIKKGDKVVTAGGIYGIIKEVQDTTFLVEVAKDVIIKIDKGSVYVAAEDAQQAQNTTAK
jgi:preprotein translocase subunit YajC